MKTSIRSLFRLTIVCLGLVFTLTGAPKGCFDDTTLPVADRTRAAQLLWDALDRETLFTYAGGLKPTSIGFYSGRVDIQNPGTLQDIEQLRRLMPAFSCPGLFQAVTHHSDFIVDGQRYLQTAVFHLPHFRLALQQHADIFSYYGITAGADPLEVIMAIQYAREGRASLMLGNILGYPSDAVDFFHAADREHQRTGQFVRRDFLSPPSFMNRNYFVWVVPEEYQKSPEDEKMFACAESILAEYKQRRDRYFGEGKPGPFQLMRDWYDDGFPRCAAELSGQAIDQGGEAK